MDIEKVRADKEQIHEIRPAMPTVWLYMHRLATERIHPKKS
jgi:hypothetical protein